MTDEHPKGIQDVPDAMRTPHGKELASSNLVSRLRDCVAVTFSAGLHGVEADCREAAEEIERLRRALYQHACHCGIASHDPAKHAEWCPYRQADGSPCSVRGPNDLRPDDLAGDNGRYVQILSLMRKGGFELDARQVDNALREAVRVLKERKERHSPDETSPSQPPHCLHCHCEEAAKGMVDRADFDRFRNAVLKIAHDEYNVDPKEWEAESWEDGYWRAVNIARSAASGTNPGSPVETTDKRCAFVGAPKGAPLQCDLRAGHSGGHVFTPEKATGKP